MRKKLLIIFFVLILFVLVFFFYRFVNSIKKDKSITEETMNILNSAYSEFDNNINTFANLREQLYTGLSDIYLEEFIKTYEEWNKFIDDYEGIVKKIDDSSSQLDKYCIYKFSNVNINNKCTTFKANYEAAMNYYIVDVKMYNEVVSKYNSFVNDGKYSYGLLDEAKFVVYDDYIDYDGDGEMFGKNE